ncbi:MAG: hypothetical protein RI990_1657 [Planctomycetota bacterium]
MLSILGPAVQPLATVFTPLIFLLSVVAMQAAQPILVLGAPARENLSLGSQAAMVFVIAWLVVRWIRVMSMAIEQQMARRGITDGLSIVRMGRSAVIGVVWLLGVAAALQIFGLDLSTVIAGLGIGTAAGGAPWTRPVHGGARRVHGGARFSWTGPAARATVGA